MASPEQTPNLRQLQLVTDPYSSPSLTLNPQSPAQVKQQRRQSSISYTSSSTSPSTVETARSSISNRRNSVDYTGFAPSSLSMSHKRRQRPLSIAIPGNNQSSSISTAPVAPRPQTLTEIYAPFLSLIANKEAQVSELRSQLAAQEKELTILKRKWEKIVRNHLAFPDKQKDGLTGMDGIDKIIRGLQTAAATAADAVSEASSDNPSPVFSRFSMDSSTPSLSADMSQSSPDTSVDIPISSKVPQSVSSAQISTTQAANSTATRRRSLVITEKKSAVTSPSEPPKVPSSSISTKSRTKPFASRQRDNALAPLPGTALSSAAFSLIPQLTNMNLNVNFSDIKGGMGKIISPQQQKRASKVFEGLWEAVAAPSAITTASDRKKEKKVEQNLLETDDDEETIKLSKNNAQFAVLPPDNSPKHHTDAKEDEFDPSAMASPSGYLTSIRRRSLYAPPIKEEEKESEESSEDGWNW